MSYLSWLWIGLAAGGIYYLAHVTAFLIQGARRLQRAVSNSTQILSSLQNLPLSDPEQTAATQPAELDALIVARVQLLKRRRKAKEVRQRRLVARLNKLISEGGSSK